MRSEIVDEHRYVQKMIKRIAEKRDFIAVLEADVFGGAGKVDVALKRDGLRIACEIAIQNTLAYEVQNIQKCFTAGFDRVAVISSDSRHLERIRLEAETIVDKEQLKRLRFLEPENFHLFLDGLQHDLLTVPEPQRGGLVKGYKVETKVSEVPETERRTKRQVILDVLSRVTGDQEE
jgi:hypothetical protein